VILDALFDTWVTALGHAFMLAKGEQINRMLLIHVDYTDSRGIHPYSEVWGAIAAIQKMIPGVHALGGVDPVMMRAEAKQAAIEQLEAELREKPLGEVMQQRRNK
jgi:hypothetical protein